MVELYCELLLARAMVLDQLAFSEKGVEARNKAKEELNRLNLEKKNSGLTVSAPQEQKKSGGGGFGWFSSSKSSTSPIPTQQQQQEQPSTTAAAEDSEDFNNEANSYINAGLDEAAVAIFYSCPRFPREVKELTTLRLLLMERWGKEFATLAQDNQAAIKIPERLVKKLRVKPPSTELVESYLREIAKAYDVGWPAGEEKAEGDVPEVMSTTETSPPPGYDDDNNDDTGDVAALPPHTPRKGVADNVRRESETDELTRATPPRDIGTHDAKGKSPISVAKPGPSTDNPEPRVRIPGDSESNQTRPGGPQRKDSKGIPNVDELSKRFAALKR